MLSLQDRDEELAAEQKRQEENDAMRKHYATAANAFHQWLTETRFVNQYYMACTLQIYQG
jgi:hypothetical protein